MKSHACWKARWTPPLASVTLGALLWAGGHGCTVDHRSEPAATATHVDVDRLRADARELFAVARERVFPALVNIHVVTVNYWGGKDHKGSAVGSGTIISPEGHVVTNQHVTNNGKKFRCTLADKREVAADLIGEDPLTDLAVLKLKLDELEPGLPLVVAVFGPSETLQVGDYVMAMGSPFALSRSVTLGIVSNTDRVFSSGLGTSTGEVEELELDEGQRTGLFTNWIQHDAAINPGNSGGPLVNLKGEVVGVNELGGDQVAFAIPSNLARTVVASLVAHGEVPRSDIGVTFKAIQRTGLTEGVLINSVDEEGPARRAGIQAGDLVLKINGEPGTVRFIEQVPPLMKRIADLPIGSHVVVDYLRGGILAEAVITTEKLQKDRGDETALRAWGLSAMFITEKMARDQRLESTAGVLVSGVRAGGPAATAEPPLARGDVIRQVGGQATPHLRALVAQYREIMARASLPEDLLVEFERRGQSQVTLIKPNPEEDVDPPREVRKAWLGVATQPVLTKLAHQLGLPGRSGFRITRVYPGTEAARSELAVGDVITKLNGEALVLRGVQDAGLLARQVRRLDIDAQATLTVLRQGREQDLTIKLEPTRLTVEEARRDRNRDFELTVREVTFFDRDANRWDEPVQGVIVEQAEEAGWAGLGGIEVGDLIQRIEAEHVTGLVVYRTIMANVAAAQPERVVFVVLRGVRTHFQYVEPDWNPIVSETQPAGEE